MLTIIKTYLFYLIILTPIALVVGFFVAPDLFAQSLYGSSISGYVQSVVTNGANTDVTFSSLPACVSDTTGVGFEKRYWNGTAWVDLGSGVSAGGPYNGCGAGETWPTGWDEISVSNTNGDGTYAIFYLPNTTGDITTADYFFSFEIVDGEPTYFSFNGETRIVLITEPTNLSVTSGTAVDFSVDYVSGTPTASTICLEFQDLTTYTTISPVCENVVQNGYLTYATTTSFDTGHLINWRAVLKDSDGNYIDTSPVYSFSVVTAQQSTYTGTGTTTFGVPTTTFFSDVTLECDPNDPFFERSICNTFVLLFSPSPNSVNNFYNSLDNLGEKLPFSVIAEVYDAWRLLDTNNDQTWATTTVVANVGGGDFDIFSFGESSVKQFVGESTWDTFMGIMGMIMWTVAGMYMFRRTLTVFKA